LIAEPDAISIAKNSQEQGPEYTFRNCTLAPVFWRSLVSGFLQKVALGLCCLGCLAPFAQAAVMNLETSKFCALYSGTVAIFTTNDSPSLPSFFVATIDWGDGSFGGVASVVAITGGYGVVGSHTYADEGAYLVSITVEDVHDASQASAPDVAYVRDAALAAQGTYSGSSPGVLFSGTVARFSDADPAALPSDFTATIDWQDGVVTSGAISKDPSGGFDVAGSHTYSIGGLKIVVVTIQDIGGSSASAISFTGDRIFADGLGG
jgi:hypothetical protein